MTLKERLTIERKQPWREELRKAINQRDRTQTEHTKMPELEPLIRSSSNREVNIGYTSEMAIIEASRCLDCINPTCISGCPVTINIPKFIKQIEKHDFLGAAKELKEANTFPSICGRVCPQEVQCESRCFYKVKLNKQPVGIGNLERFVADFERNTGNISLPEVKRANGIKIGIIGSGPASLAAAADLAKEGFSVTIFEALHEIGGVLRFGIPEFRLSNHIVDEEIETLKKIGVKFVTNFLVGRTATLTQLRESGIKAFFIGSGAGLPKFMNIPGENLVGVSSSSEYLTRINLMSASQKEFDTPVMKGENIAVIGGGNTAMDSARTAKRLGAHRVMVIYRRSIYEIPARKEELIHAIEEGIEFLCLHNPVAYFADEKGRVKQVKVQKMELCEPDASGRRKTVPVKGSEYFLDADMVIVSIGVFPNPLLTRSIPELALNESGAVIIDQLSMQTSIPDVFAGGDIVRGGATVILAMGDGRKAAIGIQKYLAKNHVIQ